MGKQYPWFWYMNCFARHAFVRLSFLWTTIGAWLDEYVTERRRDDW